MPRPPVRLLAGALIGALMFMLTSIFGVTPAHTAVAVVDPETAITLKIAKCEGCVVTLLSYDGLTTPYSSLPSTVVAGSVTITLPSARTAGMSVRIVPTWLTSAAPADTQVAWRYNGKAIGDAVTFKEARAKRRASGCWAGTVNAAVTLTVNVRRVNYRGRVGAIAWAPVTESFVPPMEKVRRGVLVSEDMLACSLYR